ncbi:MAG TPA: hypothetical protein V6C81_23365 [Planktothrix sp.]
MTLSILLGLAHASAAFADVAVPPGAALPSADQATLSLPIAQSADTQPAQATPGQDQPRPADLTPVQLPERGPQFTNFSTFETNALYKLPSRMFFSTICDNSLRLETNVYQTEDNYRQDMIYRVFPDVLAGYALTDKTRVAANYFFFRDQYTTKESLSRNIHSIGLRVDHDINLTDRTTLTPSFFGRALLTDLNDQASHELTDLIPGVTLSHRVGYADVVYAAVLGQLRWQNMFIQFQEGDQFYSIGSVMRRNLWTFWTDLTLASNFGKVRLRDGQNNQVIIMTLEAARQLSRKYPLSVYVQAQPIFNIGASSPGYAGVNFRVFGGLRVALSKPAIFPVKLPK